MYEEMQEQPFENKGSLMPIYRFAYADSSIAVVFSSVNCSLKWFTRCRGVFIKKFTAGLG